MYWKQRFCLVYFTLTLPVQFLVYPELLPFLLVLYQVLLLDLSCYHSLKFMVLTIGWLPFILESFKLWQPVEFNNKVIMKEISVVCCTSYYHMHWRWLQSRKFKPFLRDSGTTAVYIIIYAVLRIDLFLKLWRFLKL
jgi:hypothetical protein